MNMFRCINLIWPATQESNHYASDALPDVVAISLHSLADAPRAFASSHSSSNSAQHLKDSIVIGETDNKGMPTVISISGVRKKFDYSIPFNKP